MLTLEQLEIQQDAFALEASFTVPKGARVAVIGPSGAGKSTLMAAIAGFLKPAAGRVLWESADLGATAPGKRPFAMLFQDNNLFPHLDAYRNVALGLRPDLRLSGPEKDRVADALGRVGLAGYEARKPAALSGGQQSRVALARVLVMKRPLLLLDEPFAALGPALKAEMLDLVADVLGETGAALMMVSHDPEDARRIASETVLVADGTAHPPTDTADLLDNPPKVLREYLGG